MRGYIEKLGLLHGVYICAEVFPLPKRSAHAFLLEVELGGFYATDVDATREPLREYSASWFDALLFIRKVELLL